MLFRQLFAIGSQNQWCMQVSRLGQIQRLLQHYLARGIVSQIRSAHHMTDALRRVVYHHGQLIGPKAIGSTKHKVADLARHVLLLRTQPTVVPVQGVLC